MRVFLSLLMVLQIGGAIAAAIAAVVKIESIVFSGAILGSTGVLIASLCFYKNLEVGFWFGLSIPSMAVLCFSMILGFDWGPHQASRPIGALIVAFTMAGVPLGVFAFRQLRGAQLVKSQNRLQFSITSLLGLMFLTAIILGLFQIADEIGLAIGVIGSYAVLAAYSVRCFYRRRADSSIGDGYPPGG